jgi:hypothetical protein
MEMSDHAEKFVATIGHKLSLIGALLLVSSLVVCLMQSTAQNEVLYLLLPGQLGAACAVMALIGSRHATWHLLIIRIIAGLVLVVTAIIGVITFTSVLSDSYSAAIYGLLFGLPCLIWWLFLLRKLGWVGDDKHATAKIVATGGVATFVIAAVMLVLQFAHWQMSRSGHADVYQLLPTALATLGSLIAAIGGYCLQHELRLAAKHADLPVASAQLRKS